jgi:protease-4
MQEGPKTDSSSNSASLPDLAASGGGQPPAVPGIPSPPPVSAPLPPVLPAHGPGPSSSFGGLPPRGTGPLPPAYGAKPRRGGGMLWWALGAILVVGTIAVGGLAYLFSQLGEVGGGSLTFHSGERRSDLREVVLEPASTRDKIAVVEMQGVISSDPWDSQGNNVISYIEEQLERAAEDDHVRAVLLKIDSPGGEVLASDEIYKLLAEFQEEHSKPVVASMGTVAASGGYYVAAPCRWIVANELTITGSIGVIMQSYNWRALMDKVGVRPQVFKSGIFKDMMSPEKLESDITSEERRMVQDLVNETFERFKAVIEEGRGLAHARNEENGGDAADLGRELVGHWKDFADGRLLSGKDAWKLGFVDELGDFSVAVDRARKLAGIQDAKLIQYLRPPSFGSLFKLLGSSQETRIQLDLGVRMPKMRTGLYFLAPHWAP